MAHTYKASSEVEQLIVDASRLAVSFKKIELPSAPKVDAYGIPWNNAWEKLLLKAIEESKPYWKEGDTKPWPYTTRAIELRSGGIRASTTYKSLVIPLKMPGQSDKVAFLKKENNKTDEGSTVKIRWEDLEEWKIAFYVFERDENIQTLQRPIRFIWVQFTKPGAEAQPEPGK